MGLFSSLGKVFKAALPIVGSAIGGPLGGAIGGAAGSLLGGSANKHAIGDANAATQLGLTNAENALNTQFGQTSANLNPFISGGQQAFEQQGDILGLHGAGAQSGILSSLQNSPLFQSLMRNGQDILLNNASATGGLRGGNIQHGLANFSADTLAQVIQQQLSNLGGMSSQGLSAANSLGSFGAQNANSIADLLVGSGKANAGAILNRQAVDNNTDSQLGKLFGGSGVSDQISGLLKSLTGGGGSIFSGSGSGYGASGGALPNFPKINIALPSSSAGLPGF